MQTLLQYDSFRIVLVAHSLYSQEDTVAWVLELAFNQKLESNARKHTPENKGCLGSP